MDLWNRAMGMRFTIKYSKNPEIPVQTFKALQGDRTFHPVHATLDIQLREYTCAAITIPT